DGMDFVDPLYDLDGFRKLEKEYDPLIKKEPDPEKRKAISQECWDKIIGLYSFHCFDGQLRYLRDVFPNAPSGTGDCCAPKLLNACYKNGKHPLSMAEFFYGSGSMPHKSFQTPCDNRCRPLLKHILGLDIVFADQSIVVVNKPHGLLAIEGKGPDKQDCIAKRVRDLYGTIAQPCIHRLDQATSGLMVLAITQEAHDRLSHDFEERRIKKEYIAKVHGKMETHAGTITIKQRLDVENRPYQIVDDVNGKIAVTEWRKLKYDIYSDTSILSLTPHTGRTHQLRLACKEMGHPILNDPLYGNGEIHGDLMLQAVSLSFTHPETGEEMNFTLDREF
ncbi:MAG: RluA family pseudouridine synthase, partial [Dehalococcoidales bacterium]|nr:RluA family pseudouridine synthase [Dehalococcoidales bacterium]